MLEMGLTVPALWGSGPAALSAAESPSHSQPSSRGRRGGPSGPAPAGSPDWCESTGPGGLDAWYPHYQRTDRSIPQVLDITMPRSRPQKLSFGV